MMFLYSSTTNQAAGFGLSPPPTCGRHLPLWGGRLRERAVLFDFVLFERLPPIKGAVKTKPTSRFDYSTDREIDFSA